MNLGFIEQNNAGLQHGSVVQHGKFLQEFVNLSCGTTSGQESTRLESQSAYSESVRGRPTTHYCRLRQTAVACRQAYLHNGQRSLQVHLVSAQENVNHRKTFYCMSSFKFMYWSYDVRSAISLADLLRNVIVKITLACFWMIQNKHPKINKR